MSGFLKGKPYGAVTVGERGQLVIPAALRKEFKISPGDKLMIFADLEKKVINLIREEDFSVFLRKASELISKLEKEVPKKARR